MIFFATIKVIDNNELKRRYDIALEKDNPTINHNVDLSNSKAMEIEIAGNKVVVATLPLKECIRINLQFGKAGEGWGCLSFGRNKQTAGQGSRLADEKGSDACLRAGRNLSKSDKAQPDFQLSRVCGNNKPGDGTVWLRWCPSFSEFSQEKYKTTLIKVRRQT